MNTHQKYRSIRTLFMILIMVVTSTTPVLSQGRTPPTEPVAIEEYKWPEPPADYNPPQYTPSVNRVTTPWKDPTKPGLCTNRIKGCGYEGNYFPKGQCTWWAAEARPDIQGNVWGNAKDWLNFIPWFEIGRTPRIGDLVIFQPGKQGAHWKYGHVAYVNYVWPTPWNGITWFYILEANGPSWAQIHFYHDGIPIRGRWVYNESGVDFLGRFRCA